MAAPLSGARQTARVPGWIRSVGSAAADLPCTDRFTVEGLQVTLNAVEPGLVGWVLKYLQPLSLEPDLPGERSFSFDCFYSDDLVLAATRYLMLGNIVTFPRQGKDNAPLKCSRVCRDISLYCNPREGIFWLADFAARRLSIVFSSRTRQPALHFARSVRDTVTCHLEDQGWLSFHAGAVETEHGALMIVGNSGAGKTSLVLALVHGGARYIANERLFVRESEQGFRVLAYPMAIAVGIGTARQFSGLSGLVETPDPLLYPRQRYSVTRVKQTPWGERPKLEDKLQLIPEELVTYVGAPGSVAGGKLRAIVVPRISKTPISTSAEVIDQRCADKILSNNFMGRTASKLNPVWSDLIFRKKRMAQGDCPRLNAIKTVAFNFSLAERSDPGGYPALLLNPSLV